MEGFIKGAFWGIIWTIFLWQAGWMVLLGGFAFSCIVVGMIMLWLIFREPKAKRRQAVRMLFTLALGGLSFEPKVVRRYFLAGLWSALLPCLLILLWHIFGWPL
jgi:hypothetical protein